MGEVTREHKFYQTMNLFYFLPIAVFGQWNVGSLEQYYKNMDHQALLVEFREDDNGLFKKLFAYSDTNKDRVLDMSDFDQVEGKHKFVSQQTFDKFIDTDHDGSVTLQEFELSYYSLYRATFQFLIPVLDNDRDEKLDTYELNSLIDSFMTNQPRVMEAAEQYFPDLNKALEKAKIIARRGNLNHNKAYDDRELTEITMDIIDLMLKRVLSY